jgi:hypothetical protein
MAKLEDKISPIELLNAIRSGRTKEQIVKQYRSSDEEIAMMLLPLYREGQLNKEEFNMFFRGGSGPAPARPAKEQDAGYDVEENYNEPPSEFFKVFSKVFTKKAGEEAPSFPEPVEAEESPEALDLQPPSLMVDEADLERLEVGETAHLQIPEQKPQRKASFDVAHLPNVLEKIMSSLASIDRRLARIERRLGRE